MTKLKKNYLAFLVITCCIACAQFIAASPVDSIGIEKNGKNKYILHKVDAKETLYSISRKYNVGINEIKNANSDLSTSISIGQIIKIPFVQGIAESKAVEKQNKTTHTVQAKETFYSISRKYNIEVADLKKANPKLITLKVGDKVFLPFAATKKNATVPEVKTIEKETPKAKVESNTVAKSASKQKELEEEEEIESEVKTSKNEVDKNEKKEDDGKRGLAINNPPSVNSNSYKKNVESGMATVIETSNDLLKYLALHKTAPMGTIIHVQNNETGQKIFVRVIGKLDNSDKSIIKLSPIAMERLGAKGEKIQVDLTYIP